MRSLPELENDDRIRRLLNDFDKRYTGQDFNSLQSKTSGNGITPEMLDGVCWLDFYLAPHFQHKCFFDLR